MLLRFRTTNHRAALIVLLRRERINAPKNYTNDGDSVWRLFYDTVKGGDYRAREANVYRLAQVSGSIIDQCVAQGVPFAREYGGCLIIVHLAVHRFREHFMRADKRDSNFARCVFSVVQTDRCWKCKIYERREMLDLVVIDGQARGVIARNLITGKSESYIGDAVILATGDMACIFLFYQCKDE